MFTKTDIKTIEQLLILVSKSVTDKMEGTLSKNRKATVYRIKLQDTIRIDIRSL